MKKYIVASFLWLFAGQVLSDNLLTDITTVSATHLNITEHAAIFASVNVEFLTNPNSILEIELPEGNILTAVFKSERSNHIQGYSWQGHIKGDDSQTINLSVFKDAVAGSIHTDQAVYEIQPLGNYQVKVIKLDTKAFPECSGGKSVLQPVIHDNTTQIKPHRGLNTIDVIAVYTPQARQGAGGHNQIKATAQAAVDAMNNSLTNSQVNTEIVLLYVGEVNYNDSEDSSADLGWMKNSNQVKNLLDLYGADMAGLLVNSLGGNSCGRGYVMRNPGSYFQSYAVQVTARSCAVGNLSFAHEFGHNMGLEHDPANGALPSLASYPWSFGHYHSGSYRTVMSYWQECTGSCPRRQYFSNPDVTYLGLPTGIDNERDNARSLGLTSSITAAFRMRTNDVIFTHGFEY